MSQTVPSRQAAEKTQALLADLWRRKRPVVEERLAVLERAATAQPLTEALRSEAHDVAHKLAGSLGMFGFEQGTRLARELELLLEEPTPDTVKLAELTMQLRELLFPAT